jgi:hypothetical protein
MVVPWWVGMMMDCMANCMLQPEYLWSDWGLNPGFLKLYQELFQLSHLAQENNWSCYIQGSDKNRCQ